MYVNEISDNSVRTGKRERGKAKKVEREERAIRKRAVRGDPDAFAELIQSQMQNMYKTARAILSNDEDCADAISETILTCWEKLGQLKNEQYFNTWLIRILVNKCNDLIRSNRRLRFVDEIPEKETCAPAEENVAFQEALGTLDERYRLIIILYYVDGFRTREIGEMLGMPEATVRTRLARGRKILEHYYTSQEDGRKMI